MGARLCCISSSSAGSFIKRTDYSLESSTASELSSHGETFDAGRLIPSTASRDIPSPPSVTGDITPAKCKHSVTKGQVSKVCAGILTPIEEEPKLKRVKSRQTVGSCSLSRAGGDSLDSCASSSFGSMRNYQKFVLTRS